jgi:hypothetical protein
MKYNFLKQECRISHQFKLDESLLYRKRSICLTLARDIWVSGCCRLIVCHYRYAVDKRIARID